MRLQNGFGSIVQARHRSFVSIFEVTRVTRERLLEYATQTWLCHTSSGPSLYYVSKGVGSEKCLFLLAFSTIFADVGWVGQKKSKNVLT